MDICNITFVDLCCEQNDLLRYLHKFLWNIYLLLYIESYFACKQQVMKINRLKFVFWNIRKSYTEHIINWPIENKWHSLTLDTTKCTKETSINCFWYLYWLYPLSVPLNATTEKGFTNREYHTHFKSHPKRCLYVQRSDIKPKPSFPSQNLHGKRYYPAARCR